MRIYIMTDQEGVAGVIDSDDYCAPDRRYYETARELLTLEVNAAIEGAIEAGATEFLVVDGHGHGSINPQLLHSAATGILFLRHQKSLSSHPRQPRELTDRIFEQGPSSR